MPDPATDRFRSAEELAPVLEHILDAPKDTGTLSMIVARTTPGARQVMETAKVSLAGGVEGDHWAQGCWKVTEDGAPHPDVQICIMNSRCIEAVAGDPANWAAAGDNFFVDWDISPANAPPGTRFSAGSAEFVVTEEPHAGCQSFADRYGRDALLFVNVGPGKVHRLRGVYARVTKDGVVSAGDTIQKLP